MVDDSLFNVSGWADKILHIHQLGFGKDTLETLILSSRWERVNYRDTRRISRLIDDLAGTLRRANCVVTSRGFLPFPDLGPKPEYKHNKSIHVAYLKCFSAALIGWLRTNNSVSASSSATPAAPAARAASVARPFHGDSPNTASSSSGSHIGIGSEVSTNKNIPNATTWRCPPGERTQWDAMFMGRVYLRGPVPSLEYINACAKMYDIEPSAQAKLLKEGFIAHMCSKGDDTPELRERLYRLYSPLLVRVLVDLHESGFGVDEASTALEELGGPQKVADYDTAMFHILNAREKRERVWTEDWAERNRVIDAIILESEGQQVEVAQVKKDRELALQQDASINLLDAPEFKNSVLLQFSPSFIRVIRNHCTGREMYAKLLILERNSQKWYKDAAKPYLLQLAGRLEKYGDLDKSKHGDMYEVVKNEYSALQAALFAIPDNPGGLPTAFIAAAPEELGSSAADKANLSDDGLQIVGVTPVGGPISDSAMRRKRKREQASYSSRAWDSSDEDY